MAAINSIPPADGCGEGKIEGGWEGGRKGARKGGGGGEAVLLLRGEETLPDDITTSRRA